MPSSADPFPVIGVELGARMENTALCVVEHVYMPTGEYFDKTTYERYSGVADLVAHEKVASEFHVRHLERRTPPVRYAGVAERVGELAETVGEGLLVIDITRTGRPVYGIIKPAVEEALADTKHEVRLCPITVTGIAGGVSHSPDTGYLAPRRDLVSAALLLFEQEQLKIAQALDLASTLTKEFENFKPKPDPVDDLEGWRLAKNDDLVLSVAMSVWAAGRLVRKVEDVPVGSLGVA